MQSCIHDHTRLVASRTSRINGPDVLDGGIRDFYVRLGHDVPDGGVRDPCIWPRRGNVEVWTRSHLEDFLVDSGVKQGRKTTASSRTVAVVAASAATAIAHVRLGGLVVRNHDPPLLGLLAVVETDLADARNRLDLRDGPGVLVEIPEGGRDLQPDFRSVPELDPEAVLAVPRQEPAPALLDLLDDGPGKVSFAGLGQHAVLFFLGLNESLEPAVSGVEHAGLGPLVEDVVQGWTLDGAKEFPGLDGGIVGHAFLEELSGLKPLDVVLGLDDPALGGWQELDRNSEAHELVGEFLPLTGMEAHPRTDIGGHHHDKEGPNEVKEGRVGPAKMKADYPNGKG